MANPFVHIELQTQGHEQARQFYSQLFDWQLNDEKTNQGDTYTLIGVGEGTAGGMFQQPDKNAPSAWIPYVDVDNLQDSTAKAQKLGASILMEVTPVPNMGAFSIIKDPTGAVLGLWQSAR